MLQICNGHRVDQLDCENIAQLSAKVMCNRNFNIFFNQHSNVYSEKDGFQALRTRKYYMQIFSE